jgi:hypothetical protein
VYVVQLYAEGQRDLMTPVELSSLLIYLVTVQQHRCPTIAEVQTAVLKCLGPGKSPHQPRPAYCLAS